MTFASPDKSSQPDPDPVVEAYKRHVDVTLIRENLKLTPAERVLKLIELQRLAEEARRAGKEAAKHPPATQQPDPR